MTDLRDRLEHALFRMTGHRTFRPGQREIIERVLAGENVLGLLSTGGGKSVTYQLPAMLLPGITLVVSPLISLMIDQVQKLRSRGFNHAAYLNSALSQAEVNRLLGDVARGRYKLLYVSPEKLRQQSLIRLLRQRGVSLVAVDEAHCISQWGHDFRTDYLRLPEAVDVLGCPPVLAVTATATSQVREEICRLFRIRPENMVVQSLNRPNIAYDVIPVQSEEEKRERLLESLASTCNPAIVYCSTRRAVEDVVDWCREAGLRQRIHAYHGGMTSFERVLIQEQFQRGELDVIAATNAFGMGIDKADIRCVFHYHLPSSLEAYIQEVGRIGRDGKPGYACLFYLPEDVQIHARLLDSEFPGPEALHHLGRLAAGLPGGAVEFSLSQLSAWLELGETALRMLFYYAELAGLLAGVTQTADGYRFTRGTCPPGEAVARMGEIMRRIRANREEKLRHMVSWLEQPDCLRRGLSRYFGEAEDGAALDSCCTRCGVDRSPFEEKGAEDAPAAEEWSLELALSRLLPAHGGTGGIER